MTPELKKRIAQLRRGELPNGYRKTMLGIVPVSWNSQRVDELCAITSGSTPKRNNPDYFTGDILWVTSGELKSKYIFDTKEKITDSAAKDSGLVLYEPGTVVIAIYGLEAAGVRGTASIIARKSTISQACMAFTKFQNVDNEFFYYWYLNHGEMIGLRYAQGTKQQNLSVDIVGAFLVCFPEFHEQRKIGAILSAQDTVIELKERLLAEKRRQKKWLMQRLLTGKQRLPGFSGEWESVTLGDIAAYAKTHAKGERKNYVSTENMQSNYGAVIFSEKLPGFVDGIAYRKGDVLVGNIRPYLKKVWKADRNGVCSADVLVLRSSEIEPSYFYYLIARDAFFEYVMKSGKGTKMPRGDKTHII
ncbi:MAG: restriction endonuclease subunit S [Oscillibacter sp.]|nr:restriction endonuclease subunit S [Oscillibacter sp.]